ncbi:hypothetical protein BDQ12DRAFT_672343 [Crucibulum laeve]|uniref:Uncharacterized protein n=1 Tax=Crucibulum laeve TaxID=68775 RepID=A0A5C3MFD5_9AGAR|nr:hypothetical protein BDQ12DRAFT_672343 [Crucibulum laeve]
MSPSDEQAPPPSLLPPPLSEATPEACDTVLSDPPPPYPIPARERRRRQGARRTNQNSHSHSQHIQTSSGDSVSDNDTHAALQAYHDDEEEVNETTPFLAPPSPRSIRRVVVRPRSLSHTSTLSAAPSLAQTVLSLFQAENDDDSYFSDAPEDRPLLSPGEQPGHNTLGIEQLAESRRQSGTGFFSRAAWRRYFRPLGKAVYWWPLFHLMVVNFPYAVAAWVYLAVLTVSGTTLLMALPVGAVLCFFNLLGARTFARGELCLQSRFHSPLAYAPPYPPRPIFTRVREATEAEIESGRGVTGGLVREKSFYKNTYAMFTDPTTYQALFYFLVIKPSITLILSLALLVFVLPAIIFILPAPAALRAVRRIGAWQANVAIEGLYLAVR